MGEPRFRGRPWHVNSPRFDNLWLMDHTTVPLAILGGGNMGRAILLGGISGGFLCKDCVLVAEPDASKHAAIAETGVRVFSTARAALEHLNSMTSSDSTGQVLLAIKPQMLSALADEVRGVIGPRVVISILAGTPGSRIRERLGPAVSVIRAMPNLPATIRQGTTAICLSDGAATGDDELARSLFLSVGQVVITIDESMMDAFTAVAGSGPAYVFYLAEAMTRAATDLGFDEATAIKIVRETIAGSAALLAESFDDPAALRAAVTSKGGTTAAATQVLDQATVMDTFRRAIAAARDRGAELSKLA